MIRKIVGLGLIVSLSYCLLSGCGSDKGAQPTLKEKGPTNLKPVTPSGGGGAQQQGSGSE